MATASTLNLVSFIAQDLVKAADVGKAARVQEILDSGIDEDATVTVDGETALIRAIRRGHLHIVDTLLAAGADAYRRTWAHMAITLVRTTTDLWTPLIYAVLKRNLAIGTKLLTAGANVNYVDEQGFSVLLHACVTSDELFGNDSHEKDLIAILLKTGANVNHRKSNGGSQLTEHDRIWSRVSRPPCGLAYYSGFALTMLVGRVDAGTCRCSRVSGDGFHHNLAMFLSL